MSPPASGANWLSFRLAGWSVWSPELSNISEWQSWAGAQGPEPVGGNVVSDPSALPAMLKRRATTLGRSMLAAAFKIGEIKDARYILSSRHGEFARTVSILETLSDFETLSPTDFSMSVDHALAGLLSIATGNMKGHTAVSAGPESFGFGLLEATTCIQERPDEPVVLVHFDEPPGGGFSDLIAPLEKEIPLVVALRMVGRPTTTGEPMAISIQPRIDEPQSPSIALDFIRFVLTRAPETASIGRRMIWSWRRD